MARQLVVLGVSTGLSLIFLLIAGLKYQSWLPMINIAFVIVTPMLVIIGEALGSSPSYAGYDEGKAAWANMGGCVFGVVLSSLFGLPLLLLHLNSIQGPAFGLWMASTVVTFVASVCKSRRTVRRPLGRRPTLPLTSAARFARSSHRLRSRARHCAGQCVRPRRACRPCGTVADTASSDFACRWRTLPRADHEFYHRGRGGVCVCVCAKNVRLEGSFENARRLAARNV